MSKIEQASLTLTAEEQQTLDALEKQGGLEWDRFRARRNKNKREKGMDDITATRAALEPLMPPSSNVIDMASRRSQDPEPESFEFWRPFIFPALCAIMLCIITIYQIAAQKSLYGDGREGLVLATILELTLIGVTVARTKSVLLNIARVLIIGFLLAHVFNTMDVSARTSAEASSTELARLQQRYEQTTALLSTIPESRVSDRMKANTMADDYMKRMEAERQRLDASWGDRITGSTAADVRTRILWLNIMAQLFFAHLLALQISRLDFSRLTRLR